MSENATKHLVTMLSEETELKANYCLAPDWRLTGTLMMGSKVGQEILKVYNEIMNKSKN